MGAFFIAGVIASTPDFPSRGPETAGQRLDRELRERDEKHQRDIREMEQKLESLRRRQIFGI